VWTYLVLYVCVFADIFGVEVFRGVCVCACVRVGVCLYVYVCACVRVCVFADIYVDWQCVRGGNRQESL